MNIHEKHKLLLAGKLIGDFVLDRLKDMVPKRLWTLGRRSAGAASALAVFAIDYGYDSIRFFVAWANVDDFLARIEDRAWIMHTLERKITETTEQMRTVRSEINELRRARNTPRASEILRRTQADEMRQADLAGEWFANRTGFRAPGGPIKKKRKPHRTHYGNVASRHFAMSWSYSLLHSPV
jgi:hypothetical protein